MSLVERSIIHCSYLREFPIGDFTVPAYPTLWLVVVSASSSTETFLMQFVGSCWLLLGDKRQLYIYCW